MNREIIKLQEIDRIVIIQEATILTMIFMEKDLETCLKGKQDQSGS